MKTKAVHLSDAQLRLLKKVAEYDFPTYEPSGREWGSFYVLRDFGLLEPVDNGRKRHEVNHGRGQGKYTSITWKTEIRVKLTTEGREFLKKLSQKG